MSPDSSTAVDMKLPTDATATEHKVKVDTSDAVMSLPPPQTSWKDKKSTNAYKLIGDGVWNPLRSYPRNAPCFCNSNKKFKKCCFLKLAQTVPAKSIPAIKKLMAKALARNSKPQVEIQQEKPKEI